ncbi:MAG: putative lipid II flippase FtsW [Myxococcota bacterium]|nr:putative lipid II flippase FtsW [Myxococcota bacterium]
MNRHIDTWLILVVISMLMLGLLMVFSSSAVMASSAPGAEFKYLTRQCFALFVGLVLCIGTAFTPIRQIRHNHMLFYALVGIGLILCFIPGIGVTVKGASRWIGFGGVNFQPSAFAKVVSLISVAAFLHKWRGQVHNIRVVIQACCIPLPLMLLILFEPDFGTTMIITLLIGFMLFIGGMKKQHVSIIGGTTVFVGFFALIMEEYRLQRIRHFWDPWSAYEGQGYQVIQGWIALHNGGLTGQGLGNSVSKRHFLPEPWTDFIAAVIGEELGFLGLAALIIMYGLLLWRGFHIAKQARDAFSMLLASSITMMLIIEAAFNLGVVLGILPPKGLVLPFISYGSSALMCNMWAIGILLSISSEKRELPLEQGWKIPKESV